MKPFLFFKVFLFIFSFSSVAYAVDFFNIPDVNSLSHEQLFEALKGVHKRLFDLGDKKESLIDELHRTGNAALRDQVAQINKEIAVLTAARDQSFSLLGSTYKKSADYLDFQRTTKNLSTKTLKELYDFHADRLTELNNRIIPLQDSLKARRELLDYMDKEIKAVKAMNGGTLPDADRAMQVLMQEVQAKQHGDKALQRALLYRQARDNVRRRHLIELLSARTGAPRRQLRDIATRNAFPVDTAPGFLRDNNLPTDETVLNRVIANKVKPSQVVSPIPETAEQSGKIKNALSSVTRQLTPQLTKERALWKPVASTVKYGGMTITVIGKIIGGASGVIEIVYNITVFDENSQKQIGEYTLQRTPDSMMELLNFPPQQVRAVREMAEYSPLRALSALNQKITDQSQGDFNTEKDILNKEIAYLRNCLEKNGTPTICVIKNDMPTRAINAIIAGLFKSSEKPLPSTEYISMSHKDSADKISERIALLEDKFAIIEQQGKRNYKAYRKFGK